MKKVVLLVTLTLVSTNVVRGMEPRAKWESLPQDVQRVIIMKALATDSNLDEAIKTIQTMSGFQKINLDNLASFTAIVHMLGDKYNQSAGYVATLFKTEGSEQYLNLLQKLMNAVEENDTLTAQKLINEGADAKGNPHFFIFALELQNPVAMVKLLLANGVDPKKMNTTFSALKIVVNMHKGHPHYEELKELLKDAGRPDDE